MATVTVSQTLSANGFTLDANAIREALSLVGADSLPNKITVKLSSAGRGRSGKRASVRFVRARGGVKIECPDISICVSRYLSPDEATRSLWHELRHIGQAAEKGGLEPWIEDYARYSTAKQSGWSHRYAANPYEVDAEDFANRFADCPLVQTV